MQPVEETCPCELAVSASHNEPAVAAVGREQAEAVVYQVSAIAGGVCWEPAVAVGFQVSAVATVCWEPAVAVVFQVPAVAAVCWKPSVAVVI